MNNDEKKVMLEEEFLENVAGGKITKRGRELILEIMNIYKVQRYSKEECIAIMKERWRLDYAKFRNRYTDNTAEDFEEYIKIIEENW